MRTVAIILLLTFYMSAADLEPQSSRVKRGTDCQSQTCKDCLESCDGCNKCPLCVLVLPSCNKGNPLASIGGPGVCEKCKNYCQSGTASCKKRCQQGKAKPVCKQCREYC